MTWAASVAGRVSGLLRYLQPSSGQQQRGRQAAPQAGAEATGEGPARPDDSGAGKALKPAPCLLGRIRGAARGPRLFPRQSQSVPAERRRPSRGRSRSPEPEPRDRGPQLPVEGAAGAGGEARGARQDARGDSGTGQATPVNECRSAAQRLHDNHLFGCFCREQFQRHVLDVGAAVEDVREQPSEFSVRFQRATRIGDLLPRCFSLLGSEGAATPIAPGVCVAKAVHDPAGLREAGRQLAERLAELATPVSGVLLLAVDPDSGGCPMVEAMRWQHTMATSVDAAAGADTALFLATAEFSARAWDARVAALRDRGRSVEPGPREDGGEPRGRTLSRGSRERRSHAPTRRVLSADAGGQPRALSLPALEPDSPPNSPRGRPARGRV